MKNKFVGNWKLIKSVPEILIQMWGDLNKQGIKNVPLSNLFRFASIWGITEKKLGEEDLNLFYSTLVSLGMYAERNKLIIDLPLKEIKPSKTPKSYFD